jgi:hypothetical protein
MFKLIGFRSEAIFIKPVSICNVFNKTSCWHKLNGWMMKVDTSFDLIGPMRIFIVRCRPLAEPCMNGTAASFSAGGRGPPDFPPPLVAPLAGALVLLGGMAYGALSPDASVPDLS